MSFQDVNTKKYLLAKEIKEKYILPKYRDKVEVLILLGEERYYIRNDEAIIAEGKICIDIKEGINHAIS